MYLCSRNLLLISHTATSGHCSRSHTSGLKVVKEDRLNQQQRCKVLLFGSFVRRLLNVEPMVEPWKVETCQMKNQKCFLCHPSLCYVCVILCFKGVSFAGCTAPRARDHEVKCRSYWSSNLKVSNIQFKPNASTRSSNQALGAIAHMQQEGRQQTLKVQRICSKQVSW